MAQPEDMVYRRGAPDTFDAAALQRDLQSIRDSSSSTVLLPGFDHAVGDPRPDAYTFVRGTHKGVIMEGRYLLHEQSGWAGSSALFDFTVFLDSDVDAAVERLKIRNKCIPGYTPEEIGIRCDAVDRVNAELVCLDKVRADHVVSAVVTL
jgi:pantothenate kinase